MQLAPAAAVAAQEAEGIGALGIDPISLLVYAVNFIILLVLLRLVAYKPVLRMLDRRSDRIRESMDEAERSRQEARRQQEEMEGRLREARQEGQRLLDQARQTAESYREGEQARARREAEEFAARAREDIQRERDEALAEVRREFADLAIRAAERVIRRSLDRQAHRDLVEEVLREGGDGRGS